MSEETEVATAATEATPQEGGGPGATGPTDADTAPKPRRRRRGSRGRGRGLASRPAGSGPEPAAAADREPEAGREPEAAETGERAGAAGEAAAEGTKTTPRRRRRRRPSAARSAARTAEGEAPGAAAERAEAEPVAEGGEVSLDDPPTTAPRRRRRRSSSAKKVEEAATEAPEPKAPKGKAPEGKAEETAAGPTRLRRARTRAAGTRTAGTRRRREAPIVVPRITDKLMVITEHGDRDQIAVLEDRDLVQHFVTRVGARSMVGNVYLGRVQNVLPGMEAAFVDVGRGRNAVLYAGEVNYSPEDLEGTPPRIDQVLKSGQAVLVQVTKDPMGGKGARLTAQISMPGRYLVLVPSSEVFGISRRLPDAERRRLKAILKKVRPPEHGVIVRTAAEGASEEAITSDLQRLLEEWEAIQKRSRKAKAPALLYEEPELTVRVVRDLFNDEEFRELVTDSPRVHETVTSYLRDVAPDLAEKARLHAGKLPAFEEFHVVEQIHKALDRKVWLPSGGYLIIERTEAMTVIDVNTGKAVGKTNLEETVVGTNLEAAREVARQLRLRDIGGIIIVDFIDMLLEQNRKKVVDTMKEALAHDKTRSQVFEIGPLGLLEITRKRVSGGLLESFSETCPTCEGRGILVNYEG